MNSVILMAVNDCFANSVVQRLKRQVLVSEVLLKEKEACHLKLADIYLQYMKISLR